MGLSQPLRTVGLTGAAAGAAIGFGAGFGFLAAMKGGGGDWAWSDGIELFAPIGAAAGFPIGYLADRDHPKKQILWKAK